MKSLLLTLFVLMATMPASARQVLALDGEKVYAENQGALEDIEVVRTSLTPKNVELFLNPVTVYNNQCVEYRDGVVCGYDSFRCGGNGHGYSQYCCWNARICSKWENVPSKSFASVTLKFGKSLPLAAGQEDHILLTPIQFERDRVQAVLGDISGVMHTRMSQGKSVHIKGLGYFRYVLDTKGVKDVKDFNFEKQVQAVRVQFIPERTRTSGGAYTRALVDTEQLEWIELPATAEDTTPGGGGGNDGDQEVNPLG